jgi:hypothetical protein
MEIMLWKGNFPLMKRTQHYWCKQKEMLCKVKCSGKAFWGPKIGKFPEFQEKLFKY